jgi:SAM-dependent methyltransferase
MTLTACDPRRTLKMPRMYTSFMAVIGADAGMRRFARDILRARPGDRVLDLGCGPGRLCAHLPGAEYTGVDIDEAYLAQARSRYAASGARFEHWDLSGDCPPLRAQTFDLIVACGLLHHLPDPQARGVFRFGGERLRPGGRLVTLDCVIGQRQHPLSRLLVSLDRGRFVRAKQGYLDLARGAFEEVEASIHHDLLRIPYSHVVLVCAKPIASGHSRAGHTAGEES